MDEQPPSKRAKIDRKRGTATTNSKMNERGADDEMEVSLQSALDDSVDEWERLSEFESTTDDSSDSEWEL